MLYQIITALKMNITSLIPHVFPKNLKLGTVVKIHLEAFK